LTAAADLHLGNLAFALSVDMNSWSVEDVYAALGGEPIMVPFSAALDGVSVPLDRASASLDGVSTSPGGSPHHPKYLICPPDVPRLLDLCNVSAPSIRVLDFGEAFFRPVFSRQPVPGTPMEFGAPEVLLNLPAEVSESIDIWALGCCIYQLLGNGGIFGCMWDSLPSYLADIVIGLGGEQAVPAR
jgi:hypothetical protein